MRNVTVLLLALLLAAAVATAGASVPRRTTAYGSRTAYLTAAEHGLEDVRRVWWNPHARWYTTYPWTQPMGAGGLATLWDVYPAFDAAALVALAHPTAANKTFALATATGAERYWNPGLRPVPGYAFIPGKNGMINTFFDDNGWFGLAFFDSYRATGNARFLRDAERAFHFIELSGWAKSGGTWWDTGHHKITSEPLAAEALLGAQLFERTHVRAYLTVAQRYIAWADAHIWNAQRHLYGRSPGDGTTMDYVQGMMIGAEAALCRATKAQSACAKAEQLAAAAAVAFPPSYHWAPETDAIYLRYLLDLWRTDHKVHWYATADAQAKQALALARDANGLYTKGWNGAFASNGRLLTPGGTLMLFAALAAAPAPPR